MGMINTIFKEVKNIETKCSCGNVVIGLPPANQIKIQLSGDALQGVYWTCDCKSTNFIPVKSNLSRFVDRTKNLVATLLVAFSMMACNGTDAQVSATTLVADVQPEPTPSASPSASPTPTPSATPYAYAGGSGTQSDPYILALGEDVDHIRDNPSAYYEMNQSINMSGIANFEPIPSFSGRILGNGFDIANLTITKTDGTLAAMFARIEATGVVSGIDFVSANVSSDGEARMVVGRLEGRLASTSMHGTVSSAVYTASTPHAFVSKSNGATYVSNTLNYVFNGSAKSGSGW